MNVAVNGGSVSNGSFTSMKSNVGDFDFLKTDNWMNFTSHSQTSILYTNKTIYVCILIIYKMDTCLFCNCR